MHFIELDKIKVGDTVAVPVKSYDGKLLLGAGRILTANAIKHLTNLGITGLYVTDDVFEDFVPEETINSGLKSSVIKNLKHLNIDSAIENAKEIVNLLSENPNCEYLNLKTFDSYTYEHSVSVAIYATLVGIAAGYDKDALYKLAYAGLLHDIGKLSIDEKILNKPEKLTYDEFEEMKRHPEYGYNLLKDNIEISATTRMGIYEHHENEDGSGYPRHLTGDKIYKFAKIIHIVDVYDALISKRPYKDPKTPHEALTFLEENRNTMFDSYYLDIFVNVVPAYPKGIMIKLSNGETAIVVKNNVGNVFRPVIRLFLTGEDINLATNEDYKDIYIV